MFTDALENILRDHCSPDAVRRVEAGTSPLPIWTAIADAGFLELFAPEAAGGAGLSLQDQFRILVLLGRYAVPLPIAQSLVARALIDDAPPGLLTMAPAVLKDSTGWQCPQVPFGVLADHVLADDGKDLLLFDCRHAERRASGVHRSQVATLIFGKDAVPVRVARCDDAHAAYGAALHACLMVGAMSVAFEMTLQYGNDRAQFGRPIGKFQAIQHNLAVMAEHVVAARVAAEAAFQGSGNAPGLLPAAIAKAVASETVTKVAAIAHAVHGAIGVTQEFNLQLHTRRLHEWRIAHGSESYWHKVVGKAVIDAGTSIVEFARNADARRVFEK
ncbi:acyl-CoA dehydrogenase [Hydrogenophaga sp. BPS33]|uniref:acyl-CoA dehydrogenase n=1 Tax=Hydrogenophaga sp. BPS33 TaxID=2651974 RepID=UPI00131F9811|nr:acyl-CoA dehydrogenase [Hydrogenophaga sp. BPS33]QHE84787.1 acyl-CoA dehydrogenase [Hydrogenophaga sp. BPS33]